jgi:cytoskeleton protein RodZ
VDEKETLGKFLKNQRESKKISLREVAKNTRVREYILKAIEEDQHDLLPPATYVKGFLLSYAKYLRLDPNDVLLRYERVSKGEPVIHPSTQPLKPKQKIPPTPPSKSKQKILWNTKQTWVVAGVIVASFIIFYFFSPYSSKPPMEPLPEKPFPQKPIIEEKPPIVPSPPVAATTRAREEKPVVEEKKPLTPSPPITATTSVQEKRSFSLQLKAVEETWVSLQVDDQSGKEMTFKPGEGISVQALNRIHMKIGNAGGLDMILNGKPLEKFGKSGEVITLSFTSRGVELERPEKPKSP